MPTENETVGQVGRHGNGKTEKVNRGGRSSNGHLIRRNFDRLSTDRPSELRSALTRSLQKVGKFFFKDFLSDAIFRRTVIYDGTFDGIFCRTTF